MVGLFILKSGFDAVSIKKMLEDVERGDVRNVQAFFRKIKGASREYEMKACALDKIITAPEKVSNASELIDAIGKGFDYRSFFKEGEDRIQKVLCMYTRKPTPETAEAGARLVAEYLRVSILDNENFVPTFIVGIGDDASGVMDAMHKAALQNSIIATQNALVDLVSQEKSMPINLAPGMLRFLTGEVKLDVSKIWTKKIISFDDKVKFHPTLGEMTSVKPRYEL